MAVKVNELTICLVALASLPILTSAFRGPPLVYWNYQNYLNEHGPPENAEPHTLNTRGILDRDPPPAQEEPRYKFYGEQDPENELKQEKRGTWFLNNVGAKHLGDEKKRAGSLSLVTFQCTRKTAVCKNGGRGPRLTKTGKGVLCACMCPYGAVQPQCEKQWWSKSS